jgi:hypothetical protein
MLLCVLAAGCAQTVPFQPMASVNEPSYGYKETRRDAQHYQVVYADKSVAAAQNWMEVRAAQIARQAGFSHIAFDKRGTLSATITDNEMALESRHNTGANNTFNPNDSIPASHSYAHTKYVYASAEVSLLNGPQGNAVAVAEILSRPGAAP